MTAADSGTIQDPSAGILRAEGHLGVVARRAIRAGEVILSAEGVIVRRPSRYSIQIGERSHIDLPEGVDPDSAPERFLWRYLNHSCEPSARLEGPDLLAARDIAVGEEITFDYNTTEYDMAEPFLCRCGACDGAWIGGFHSLDSTRQRKLEPFLAPWLKRRMDPQLSRS